MNVKREGKQTPYHSSFIQIMIDSSIMLWLMDGIGAALMIARMCLILNNDVLLWYNSLIDCIVISTL